MKRYFAFFSFVLVLAACSSSSNNESIVDDTKVPGTNSEATDTGDSESGSSGDTETGTEVACEDKTCVWPPADSCINETTLRAYNDAGQCDDDVCVYGYEDVTCDHGCKNGACSECAGNSGCEDGEYCRDGVCAPCIVDEHCGPDCADCTADGQVCDREGTGCVDDASCPAGFAGADCETCVRFVDVAAPGEGSGMSWDQALGDIQAGIDAAASAVEAEESVDVCEVWVAAGTYEIWGSIPGSEDPRRDTIRLKPHVALYGGFSGMGNEAVRRHRDPSLYPTVLWGYQAASSQNRVYHVVTAKNIDKDDGVVLDGFIITGGLADGPLPDEEPLDDDEVLRHVGGGVVNIGASYLIEGCHFLDNAARGAGALANHEGSAPTVRGCLFDGNIATHFEGGAVQNWGEGSDAAIVNCVFTRNASKLGGAGIFNIESSPTIVNSSFSQNTTSHRGRAVYVGADAAVELTNSILYKNHGIELYVAADENATADVQNSIIEGGHGGENVIDEDPLFVGAVNLRLQTGSPAIDAGHPAGAPQRDFDGAPRPVGPGVDIGAFEYQGP